MPKLSPTERMRFDRRAEHLHRLGARATAEFLLELSATIGGLPAIVRLLEEYQGKLSPDLLRAAGGYGMPSRRPRVLPAEIGRASA